VTSRTPISAACTSYTLNPFDLASMLLEETKFALL
jgi:hypothetical protein